MLTFFTRQFLKLPYWLWFLLAIIILLRIPSLFEPFYYGDELIYLTLGEGIRRGLVLYQDIFDHKTPFLYYIAALAGNVFWFRLILGGWMLVTTVLYYKLINQLFSNNKKIVFFALLIFTLLTTIPLWEGQISNAELFMMLPVIAGILVVKKLFSHNKQTVVLPFSKIALSGASFSLATLFKVPAMFEVGAVLFLAFVVYTQKQLYIRELLRFVVIFIAGFSVPILISLLWFWSRGALQDYIYGGLLINVGYISAFRPDDVQEPFLVRNAPLLLRAAITFVGLAILHIVHNKLSKSFMFLSAWLLVSLFAVTLSERPYPHYLIQLAPALAGLFGILIASQRKEQVMTIFPLTLTFIAITYFNFWYYHTTPYYSNFINYTTGKYDKQTYYENFDKSVTRNYQIAEFIQQNTRYEDPIFVWGDSSHIYAISRRLPPLKYLTSFHINDFYSQDKAIQDIQDNIPQIVVILPESTEFPGLYDFLVKTNYTLVNEIDGAEIWQVQYGVK